MAGTYSVSQINSYIKNMFSTDFVLASVKVSGEISNCKYHSSGHIYFSVKDDGGVLSCVMFAGDRRNLRITLREGLKVFVSGSINVYERDGKYQLYAKNITLDGEGELYLKYVALKNELAEMGMFDPCYKKPIPQFVKTVGVVTAGTGAAIQDIINVATRRNPYVQLYLYPAKVQGEGAAKTIVDGIRTLDAMNLDVIIVGRGGGSIEDLWAFNEECVARAIFECNTPVISGVGHEVDYTIADFVSDLRAPTPSAACELAVYDVREVINRLDGYQSDLDAHMNWFINLYRNKVTAYAGRINAMSPIQRVQRERIYLDKLTDNLSNAFARLLENKRKTLQIMAGQLSALSPVDRISGGFAYLENDKHKRITTVSEVKPEDNILVRLRDGSFAATVTEVMGGQNGEGK